MQCAMGRENGTLRAGEWKAIEEGTQEKVQSHRIDKALLLGRGKEKGQAAIENSLCPSMSDCPPAHREQSITGENPPAASSHWLYTLEWAPHPGEATHWPIMC